MSTRICFSRCPHPFRRHGPCRSAVGRQVEALLKGKTFHITYEGGEGDITWHDDFAITMTLKQADGTTSNDAGTYRFDGKGYCSVWEKLAGRTEERCFTVVKTGDTAYDIINPDGTVDLSNTM